MLKKLSAIITFSLACALPTLAIAAPEKPQLDSKAYILVDGQTNKPLLAKNATNRRSPASTTKLMTALLVLENGELDDVVTISEEDLQLNGDYATYYLYAGEQFTVEQLLHALLIQSANAAGNTLARYIDGSTEKFTEHMTARAKELGCTNTRFINPYGKTNNKHYSTAQDLAIIAKEAMCYPIIRKIIHTKYYRLPTTNIYKSDDRVLWNTDSMIYGDNPYYDARVRGGKTGYTRAAGRCLVTLAQENKQKLYAVVLGGSQSSGTDSRYTDTKKLLDYGFALKKEEANATAEAPIKSKLSKSK